MSDTVYCHHCRIQHPRDEMRLIISKYGKHWRCAASIKAAAKAKNDVALRDAYGRQATDENKALASLKQQLRSETEKSSCAQ